MQKYLPVLRNCPFFTGLTDDEILSILHCVSAAKITGPGAPISSVPEIPQRSWDLCCPAPPL